MNTLNILAIVVAPGAMAVGVITAKLDKRIRR